MVLKGASPYSTPTQLGGAMLVLSTDGLSTIINLHTQSGIKYENISSTANCCMVCEVNANFYFILTLFRLLHACIIYSSHNLILLCFFLLFCLAASLVIFLKLIINLNHFNFANRPTRMLKVYNYISCTAT